MQTPGIYQKLEQRPAWGLGLHPTLSVGWEAIMPTALEHEPVCKWEIVDVCRQAIWDSRDRGSIGVTKTGQAMSTRGQGLGREHPSSKHQHLGQAGQEGEGRIVPTTAHP